eukprot:TRINITY_DN468_c0_g2_i1.p1 TRINITY_DN468_c0_g2~~TRINITY_DN468_c0_g2_i1.p1  ORF type:complete len:280 (+),score=48.11 TRINITY_DN468_c0_g2_i1:15-854(+)
MVRNKHVLLPKYKQPQIISLKTIKSALVSINWANQFSEDKRWFTIPKTNGKEKLLLSVQRLDKQTPSPAPTTKKAKSKSQPVQIPQIAWTTITVGKHIGNGSYGDVFQGQWQNRTVAIKKLILKTIPEHQLADFKREVKVLAMCECPEIVSLFAVCTETGNTALIMEYLPNGSLDNALNNPNVAIPWDPLRWQIAADIARGLAYLHQRGILHRDLKSPNVLLTDEYHAKLTDFGMANVKLLTSTHKKTGTVRFSLLRMGFKAVSVNITGCSSGAAQISL